MMLQRLFYSQCITLLDMQFGLHFQELVLRYNKKDLHYLQYN